MNFWYFLIFNASLFVLMIAYLEKISPSGGASFLWKRRREARFGFAWHFHPEFEITGIEAGRGRRFVGDSQEDYGAGDLVLLGPNLPHTWASAPGGRGANSAAFCQFRGGIVPDAPEFRSVRALLARASRGLVFPRGADGGRLAALGGLTGARRYAGLLELLDRLASRRGARPLASPAYAPGPPPEASERIERVCRALDDDELAGLSLPEAARLAHLSVPAFGRAFKRATGKTLVGYLNELRVGRACRELLETSRPVSDVAFDCGFRNLSNFNRRFRALKGVSPREFRRRHAPV